MAPNPAALMYQVFEGNPDAYGHEDGGCVRGSAYEAVELHCFKSVPCGIYPMRADPASVSANGGLVACVKWGCIDIDNGSKDDALLLHKALKKMKLYPWIEPSRSKGFHLWVFAREWVTAWSMRRALLFARQACELDHIKEVNPKAESFEHLQEGLGNYVRLPYVGFRPDENGRRTMVYPGSFNPVPFHTFIEWHGETAVTENDLRKWANRYKPPAPPVSLGSGVVEFDAQILARCNNFLKGVVEFGPAEWRSQPGMGGRSALLTRCAHEARKSGLNAEEALGLLYALNKAWGKYETEARAEKYLTRDRDEAYK